MLERNIEEIRKAGTKPVEVQHQTCPHEEMAEGTLFLCSIPYQKNWIKYQCKTKNSRATNSEALYKDTVEW